MSILIDGYNLMYAAGMISRGIGPGTLERARAALLNFVAAAVEPDELSQTVVVFDAKDAPPGLESTASHRGLTVRYASEFNDADELLETLIRAEPAPNKLLVVSSDHRVQNAARRRRAQFVDSDVWYDNARRERTRRQAGALAESHGSETTRDARPSPKQDGAESPDEIARWLAEFGMTGEVDGERKRASQHNESSPLDDVVNPFPPGYCDDLLDSTRRGDDLTR